MTSRVFRAIDTGLRSARENVALDQAMVDARQAEEIPDSFRFIGFETSVLVGRHQDLAQEVNLAYCAENSIETARRITGGGAIFMDPSILGWALVCHKDSLGGGSLGDVTEKICTAVAAGLSRLGVEARFRPRNDIEINGRKISGTGGFYDGNTLMYQGTIVMEQPTAHMFQALNVARDKYEKHGIAEASARVTNLKAELGALPPIQEIKSAILAELGSHLGIDWQAGELSQTELSRAKDLYGEDIGTDDFVAEISDAGRDATIRTAEIASPGGRIKAFVRLEGAQNDRIRELLITGDFFVTPPRTIYDLESHMRRVEISDIDNAVKAFFNNADIGMLSASADHFSQAISAAAHAGSDKA